MCWLCERDVEGAVTCSCPQFAKTRAHILYDSGATMHVKYEHCARLAKPTGARLKAAWLSQDPPTAEAEMLSIFSWSGQMRWRAGQVAETAS